MTKAIILSLFAETALHPGAGKADGAIDLPVAREGATNLPQVPDSSLKGALRQWAKDAGLGQAQTDAFFGSPNDQAGGGGAGQLLIASARLLYLPLRRLDGPYAWTSTPYLQERLARDAKRLGITTLVAPSVAPLGHDLLMASPPAVNEVFLEEYHFAPGQLDDTRPTVALANVMIENQVVANRIADQAAYMSDAEFAWYAANGLPVQARNQLDENTKLSKNLWYEETLPVDTLLFAPILLRTPGEEPTFDEFVNTVKENPYLQIGGNETVGQGWVRMRAIGAS